MTDILRFAGDIAVEKVAILSYDKTQYSVINQLISIQIFEDLFSPFTSGVLTFKDSLDFMNALPVIGQEILDLDIHTPTLKNLQGRIQGQFYIYDLKNREFLADKSVVYELGFISKEAIVDMNVKLSKGFQGRISDIAREVLTHPLVGFDGAKNLIIEPTKNSMKYVSNYWTPTKNLRYISDAALNENNSPTFLFFENRDGLNFASLDSLGASEVEVQEFKYDSSTQEVSATGSSSRNITRDFQRIIEFSLKSGFNLINRTTSGMIASSAFGYDITTKRYALKTFDYFSEFPNRKHLNKYQAVTNAIPSYFTSRMMFVPKPYENFENFGANSSFDFVQRRVSEMIQAEDFKIEIQVPGRLDYTVGQVAKIKSFQIAPLRASDNNSDQIDAIFSGRYLISAINHFITRESHQCSIELVKDSYISSFKKKGQT